MVGRIEIVKAGADERSCDSAGCENESFVVLKGGQRCGVCGNQLHVCRKCFADLAYRSRGILAFDIAGESFEQDVNTKIVNARWYRKTAVDPLELQLDIAEEFKTFKDGKWVGGGRRQKWVTVETVTSDLLDGGDD